MTYFGPRDGRQVDERKVLINMRHDEADAAYDAALAPARLGLGNKKRRPYPEVMPEALAAYDAVIAKWHRRLFR